MSIYRYSFIFLKNYNIIIYSFKSNIGQKVIEDSFRSQICQKKKKIINTNLTVQSKFNVNITITNFLKIYPSSDNNTFRKTLLKVLEETLTLQLRIEAKASGRVTFLSLNAEQGGIGNGNKYRNFLC